MIHCPNPKSPEFKELATKVPSSKLLIEWNKRYNPDWKEDINSIVSYSEASKILNKSVSSQISPSQEKSIKSQISAVNTRNFKKGIDIVYRYIDLGSIGESQIQRWSLVRLKGRLNADKKAQRLKEKIVDPSQTNTKYKEFKRTINNENQQGTLFQKVELALDQKYNSELGIGFQEFYDTQEVGELTVEEKVKKKVSRLQESIDVNVEYDNTLVDKEENPVRGAVIKKNGKVTVVLNTEYMKEDTVDHEFAHIFIDILGGLSNQRIKAAVNKLRNTKLWDTIKKRYPELSDDNLSIEVLAEAIGKQAIKNDSWWDRFVNWFFDLLGIRLNTTSNVIKDLVTEMYSLKKEPAYMNMPQFQKVDSTELNTKLESINDIYEELIKKLDVKVKVWRNKIDPESEEGIKLMGDITNFKEDIENAITVENKKYIYQILKNINDSYNDIIEQLNNRIDNDELPTYILNSYNAYVSTFSIVEDINDLLEKSPEEFSDFSEDEIIDIKNEIGGALAKDLSFKRKIKEYSLKKLAKKYANKSKRIHRLYELRFEDEFNKNQASKYKDKNERKKAKNEFIRKSLLDNKSKIEQEEFEWFYNQLQTGYDITEFHSILDSGQVNSTIIQVVQKILDKQDYLTAGHYNNDRMKIEELRKKLPTQVNQEKLFSKLIDITDDGTYLVDEFKPEYYEKWHKITAEIDNAIENHGKGSDAHTKAKQKLKNLKPERNPKFQNLTQNEKEVLEGLKSIYREHDKKLFNSGKVEKKLEGMSFYLLPFIEKSKAQRIYENSFLDTVKRTFGDIYQKRNSETDTEMFQAFEEEDGKIKEVYTDEKNEELYRVPLYYRNHIDRTNRSYDIFSITLANSFTSNNFKHKQLVSADLELINQLISNKEYIGKRNMRVLMSKLFKRPVPKKSNNESKMLKSILENRLYGMGEIERLGGKANKIANFINGWASTTMLGLNYFAAIPNLLMGTTMNIGEAIGGNIINTSNLKKAYKNYFNDFPAIARDINSSAPRSKTNMLNNLFEVLDDSSHLSTKYMDEGSFRKHMKKDTIFFFSHGIEHHLQSVVMYAVLDKLNLTDRITIENGSINFKNVKESEMLHAKSLIRKIVADLHGQYDTRMKSEFQREWYGSSALMFRKWLLRGTTRRLRGVSTLFNDNIQPEERYFSEESGEFEEGTYISALKFLKKVILDFKKYKFNVLGNYQKNMDTMSSYQKSNMRKVLFEMGVAFFLYSIYLILANIAEDEDDNEMTYLAAYWFRRTVSELMFWANPTETFRILSNPAASISFLEKGFKLAYEMMPGVGWNTYERRSGNYEKGDLKILKRIDDITPIKSQLFRYENASDALSWLNR